MKTKSMRYSNSASKSRIERIHLDYLCDHFRLRYPSNPDLKSMEFRPDLEGIDRKPDTYFEMKSRTYPRNSKKGQPQYEWWSPAKGQTQRHSNFVDNNPAFIYWILLLGHTEKLVTETDLCEDSILHRDIYVLPWDAYGLVNPAEEGRRHLGLARLKSVFDFETTPVEKGELSIAKDILFDVEDYFYPD